MAKNIVSLKVDGTSYSARPYGTCATAAGTAAKAVTCADFSLTTGATILVKFTYANSVASPTLNVNSTGAKPIYYRGAALSSSLYYWGANDTVEFYYNGTQWDLLNVGNTNSTYANYSFGNGYTTCATEEATTAKVATYQYYSLATGGIVAVKFTYAVPANSTLNINSKGAKSIYYNNAAITAGVIGAGDIATFVYDGTNYVLLAVDSIMTAAEKTKLSGIATGATANKGTVTSITPGTGLTGASSDSAITSSGTINLKNAATGEIGGIKVGTVNSSTVTTKTEGSNYYPVNIDSNGKGYVALPTWSNNSGTITGATAGKGLTGGGTSGSVTLNVGAGTGISVGDDAVSCNLNSTTSLGTIGTTSKLYAVGVDANNKLCVNVPWSDTNTDTHYTTGINAGGSGATSNAAVTNPYVTVKDNSTHRGQIQLKGGGVTTVTSDANGVITISSTDTNTDTKVTSAANHYTPTENTDAAISASGGSATNITGTSGKLNVVTGLKRDAKGHIVGVTSANIYSTDNNTTYGLANLGSNGLMSATTYTALAEDSALSNLGDISFKTDQYADEVSIAAKQAVTYINYTNGETSHNESGVVGTIDIPAAATDKAGVMSAADKTKLDGIATGANKYTLPAATSSTLGGVKIGSNISVSSGTISLSKSNVTSALGYTPVGPTGDYTVGNLTGNMFTATDSSGYSAVLSSDSIYLIGNGTTPVDIRTDGIYAPKFITTGGTSSQFVRGNGSCTALTKSEVTTALGYTPPTTNSTYANYSFGNGYATCATTAGTANKVATYSNYSLQTGGIVAVKFTYAVGNTSNTTLNINSKGAKPIYHNGSYIESGIINAGDIATFVYDGTRYNLISVDSAIRRAPYPNDGTSVSIIADFEYNPNLGYVVNLEDCNLYDGGLYLVEADESSDVDGDTRCALLFVYKSAGSLVLNTVKVGYMSLAIVNNNLQFLGSEGGGVFTLREIHSTNLYV